MGTGRVRMKRPTIKDIARELGISIGTVYRALNNTGRIKPETKRRVLEKAEEMNYIPNITARKFALKAKLSFLVVMPDEPVFYWGDVKKGTNDISLELSEFGVGVDVLHTVVDGDGGDNYTSIMQRMDAVKYDGIILAPIYISNVEQIIARAGEDNIPVVMMNDGREYAGRLFYYGPDNVLTGALAGEVLGKLIGGSGTVSVLVDSAQSSISMHRMHGFASCMKSGFPGIKVEGLHIYEKGRLREFMARREQTVRSVDGVYAMSSVASGDIAALLGDMGIRLPLVGHEASPLSREMLTKGQISALICEQKVGQGYYPVKLLYDYLVQGILPGEGDIFTDLNIVMSGNLHMLDYSEYGRGYR